MCTETISSLAAELHNCRRVNEERFEFDLETSVGKLELRAASHDWYLMWTDGMASVMEYAKSMASMADTVSDDESDC